MKLRQSLVFLVMLSVLGWFSISCSKGRQLVGTWQANIEFFSVTLTFFKDGTGVIQGPDGGKSFKWRVEGDELVFTDQDGEAGRGPFELKEGILILYDDTTGEPLTFFK